MKLSTLRQRSLEALRLQASRGELLMSVAVGYVKVRHDRIANDPDCRVREALDLVFRKFAEFRSIRQVHLWLRQEEVQLPAIRLLGDERRIVWKAPVYGGVHKSLTNPMYAGAYAYGRIATRVTVENGRKRVVRGFRREREDWDVLIRDHHEGYVSWEEFERNQRLIADNANCKGLMVRGAHINHGTKSCIAFGGLRVDTAVADEVLWLLSPLGIEAALAAVAMREDGDAETRQQVELALTQARYEADLARRQYDAIDPTNRLVANELERRWNDRLKGVGRQEERVTAVAAERPERLSPEEKERLMALGDDLATAWSPPNATAETRKRIVRTVVKEIVVTLAEEHIELLLHWQGGDHTRLSVLRNRTGQHRFTTTKEVGDLIRSSARQLSDGAIASMLNRLGKKTGRGNTWTQVRVCSFRNDHDIAVYRPGEMAERGELTLKEAAERLGVSTMTVLRLIGDGTLSASQVCKGAPWAIPADQLDPLKDSNFGEARPRTADSNQKELDNQ